MPSTPASAPSTATSSSPQSKQAQASAPPEKSRNAKAQKAHRERKNAYVKQLEERVELMSTAMDNYKLRVTCLEHDLSQAHEELRILKAQAKAMPYGLPHSPTWTDSTSASAFFLITGRDSCNPKSVKNYGS